MRVSRTDCRLLAGLVLMVSCLLVLHGCGGSAVLASERDAVVIVRSPAGQPGQFSLCSGVCVSADGLVLTAEHCECGAETTVEILGRTLPADVLHEPEKNGVDEASLLKIRDAGPFPFRPIAQTPPAEGDSVRSHGFPGGIYAYKEGTVLKADGMVKCDFRIYEGNSGGPLLNEAGEVIGICSARSLLNAEPFSLWIPPQSIQAAFAAAGQSTGTGKPTLVAFVQNGCSPCVQFKRDVAEGHYDGFNVVYVNWVNGRWDNQTLVREMRSTAKRTTDGSPVPMEIEMPAFWVRGGEVLQVGYGGGKIGLLNWIGELLWRPREPGTIELGSPSAPSEEPREYRRLVPEPEPEPEIDWSTVEIVVLIEAQDVGDGVRDTLRRLALDQATGPLERAVREHTGDKAALRIVAQRTRPTRFDATVDAARIVVSKAAVVVMVARQAAGIRGQLVGAIERIVMGKLDGALDGRPVDVIFERTSPDDFQAVRTALQTEEPTVAPAPADVQSADPPTDESEPQPWWLAVITTLWGLWDGMKRKVQA